MLTLIFVSALVTQGRYTVESNRGLTPGRYIVVSVQGDIPHLDEAIRVAKKMASSQVSRPPSDFGKHIRVRVSERVHSTQQTIQPYTYQSRPIMYSYPLRSGYTMPNPAQIPRSQPWFRGNITCVGGVCY